MTTDPTIGTGQGTAPCASPTLALTEARNALRAEAFRKLPDDIALWRFREVLTQLGAALGLSGGAVVYALDLMGMLTEADWRGDGRAVTFHSVRGYARKVGRSERTICGWERQLIAAGLVHRTLRHARRHGGYGDERRRTGLDWRSFGARMPELLEALARQRAEAARRLDLETRIRAERRLVQGLAEGMEEGRARGVHHRLLALQVLRLRGDATVADLEARLLALTLLRGDLVKTLPADVSAPVGNPGITPEPSDQSERTGGLIDDTPDSSCPADIRSTEYRAVRERLSIDSPVDDQDRRGIDIRSTMPKNGSSAARTTLDAIPLTDIWKAAPDSWKTALGPDIPVTWPILIELADRLAPGLEVSPWAWSRALRILGPSEAAMALMILDRNRDHPVRPVHSVGGALVGMVRRAEARGFDLAPSLRGIIGRTAGKGRGVGLAR